MATYLHEGSDGRIVEYRRGPIDPVVLHLEARELRRDGTPHNDAWYPVSDWMILRLQEIGSDIVQLIHDEAFGTESHS